MRVVVVVVAVVVVLVDVDHVCFVSVRFCLLAGQC